MTKYKKWFVIVFISSYSLIKLLSLSKDGKVLAAYDVRANAGIQQQKLKSLTLGSSPILPSPTHFIPTEVISTVIPTPTITFLPTIRSVLPTEKQQKSSVGNSFIDEINLYRSSKGVGPLNTDSNTCNFAATRVQEVVTDFSHNGFYGRQERSELPYPSYTTVSENIANAPGGNPVTMWIASPSHEANLVQNVTYGCVMQSGDFYVYEGWSP